MLTAGIRRRHQAVPDRQIVVMLPRKRDGLADASKQEADLLKDPPRGTPEQRLLRQNGVWLHCSTICLRPKRWVKRSYKAVAKNKFGPLPPSR
jgi:hypothetical protein